MHAYRIAISFVDVWQDLDATTEQFGQILPKDVLDLFLLIFVMESLTRHLPSILKLYVDIIIHLPSPIWVIVIHDVLWVGEALYRLLIDHLDAVVVSVIEFDPRKLGIHLGGKLCLYHSHFRSHHSSVSLHRLFRHNLLVTRLFLPLIEFIDNVFLK